MAGTGLPQLKSVRSRENSRNTADLGSSPQPITTISSLTGLDHSRNPVLRAPPNQAPGPQIGATSPEGAVRVHLVVVFEPRIEFGHDGGGVGPGVEPSRRGAIKGGPIMRAAGLAGELKEVSGYDRAAAVAIHRRKRASVIRGAIARCRRSRRGGHGPRSYGYALPVRAWPQQGRRRAQTGYLSALRSRPTVGSYRCSTLRSFKRSSGKRRRHASRSASSSARMRGACSR
jgi:hypothetical protein